MNQENSNSKICPICGRPTHKKSQYCIFHASAEEKTEEDFKQAITKYVNRAMSESSGFNFKQFIFKGDLDFSKDFNLSEIQRCNFENTEFYYGKICFDNIVFLGETKFINCKFGSKASFAYSGVSGRQFRRHPDIKPVTYGHLIDSIFINIILNQ